MAPKELSSFEKQIAPKARLALLVGLVLQNSFTAVVGRATRISSSSTSYNELYSINHLIVISEAAKLLLSLLLELRAQKSLVRLKGSIHRHIFQKPMDAIKGSLISTLLYLFFNTMQYILRYPIFLHRFFRSSFRAN